MGSFFPKIAAFLKPKRRWFQFSLRTLFLIMVVFAIWLSFQAKWKRDRNVALGWIQEQAEFWEDLPVDQLPQLDEQPPFPLRFFGAKGLKQVCVVVADKERVPEKQRELDLKQANGDG